jgi:nucleoside-diphosphate-sugar epimerase
MLGPTVNATMNWVVRMTQGPKDGKAPNDSMSFVDVRDCAAMHVAGLEVAGAAGRYMCVAGTATNRVTDGGAVVYASTHWNDIYALVKELYPAMPDFAPCDSEPVVPTSFDLSKSNTLLHVDAMRSVKTILKESISELKVKGAVA